MKDTKDLLAKMYEHCHILKQPNLDDNSVNCAIGPHVNRIFMIELNCQKIKIKIKIVVT
jgi:hypothetical protein